MGHVCFQLSVANSVGATVNTRFYTKPSRRYGMKANRRDNENHFRARTELGSRHKKPFVIVPILNSFFIYFHTNWIEFCERQATLSDSVACERCDTKKRAKLLFVSPYCRVWHRVIGKIRTHVPSPHIFGCAFCLPTCSAEYMIIHVYEI